MVTIKSIRKNKTTDGREFVSLELVSGVEFVQSNQTGKFYATQRHTSMPTTFDEGTAQQLIGTSMPGTITRVSSDPYDYIIKATGEVIQLSHSYQYFPEDSAAVATRELELVD